MTLVSPRGLVMLSYLPRPFYSGATVAPGTVMGAILQAQGVELDLLKLATDQVLLATYLSTAPDWSLPLWESEFGLLFDGTLSSAQRKARIAPLLLGGVMPTLGTITALVATYIGTAFTVAEEIPTYTVWIRFAGLSGIPANWLALKAALRAALPAHLRFELVFGTGLTWDQLDALGWTWDYLDALNIDWDQLEVL